MELNTKKYVITKYTAENTPDMATRTSTGTREYAITRVKQMYVDMGYIDRLMWENGTDENSTVGVCDEDGNQLPFPSFLIRRVN